MPPASPLADSFLRSGKVRDLYAVGEDRLLLVASDRLSAFDVVLPTPIPDKGRVLTGVSRFWFDRTADLVANHLVGVAPEDIPGGGPTDAAEAARSALLGSAESSTEAAASSSVPGSVVTSLARAVALAERPDLVRLGAVGLRSAGDRARPYRHIGARRDGGRRARADRGGCGRTGPGADGRAATIGRVRSVRPTAAGRSCPADRGWNRSR